MKILKLLLFIYLSFFLFHCNSYREYPIEYDYSYYGKFNKYKSFSFLKNNSSTIDSTNSYKILKKNIKSRLEIQGYEYKPEKADLLVSYTMYFDSLNFRGYNQVNIEQWIKNEKNKEEKDYIPRKYSLKKGTILIQLYDRKQERTIWQGYSTGIFNNNYLNNEIQLRKTTQSILDKYIFLAEDFMKDKEFILKNPPPQ